MPSTLWRKIGNRHVLRMPIPEVPSICFHAGFVRQKNDKRWAWCFQRPDAWAKAVSLQGVAATEESAKAEVETTFNNWPRREKA